MLLQLSSIRAVTELWLVFKKTALRCKNINKIGCGLSFDLSALKLRSFESIIKIERTIKFNNLKFQEKNVLKYLFKVAFPFSFCNMILVLWTLISAYRLYLVAKSGKVTHIYCLNFLRNNNYVELILVVSLVEFVCIFIIFHKLCLFPLNSLISLYLRVEISIYLYKYKVEWHRLC